MVKREMEKEVDRRKDKKGRDKREVMTLMKNERRDKTRKKL